MIPNLLPTRLPLSIVVPTTHPWPAVEDCLNILGPQCRALGAEIVIADSTGEGLPRDGGDQADCVRAIVVPGADVFTLRAHGTAAARGDIVAWTEDHCRPAPDWCRRMLEIHAQYPEVDAVGGAVVNGSTGTAMDWSNFLCTFGPFVPPLGNSRIPRVPAAANLSLKRRVIPAGPMDPGFIEFTLEPLLWNSRKVRFDDRAVVRHVQSWGWWGTPRAHFHNGRSTTGLAGMNGWRRLRRMPVCALLPFEILRTAALPLIRKQGIPLLRCLPCMAMLAVAHSAGELTGLLTGAGESPLRLE